MPRPPVASLPLLAALLAAAPLRAQSSSLALTTAALDAHQSDLIAFRRELHRRPELSGDEAHTAAAIAMRLRAAGFAVRTDVGGHGIVAVLRGARPGPLVAFRADMDAVRSDAPDPVPFRSEYPGIRHICGHDVHATIGLAIADAFGAARARLAGSVMLVFQPAEESANGARAMLADGALASERPVAIYAVHTAPLEVGTLGTMAGGLMPGRDRLRVTLSGSGDVAAAALAAERLIEAANTVADAFVAVLPDLVYVSHVTRRRIADDAWAVVAGLSIADAGVRTRVRETLERELRALQGPGIAVDVRYDARTIAGVTNDPALVVRANAAIAAALGPAAVRPITRVVPVFSEDFGSFQEQVPGVMYFLGVSNTKAGTRGMPHAPDYVADEGAILVGARAMVAVMLERMGEG